ncbi:putative cysteine ligase BshC [Xylanibacillus composti]|uniref:Putative cysteine ligase BshC n=2 Tax=Xylanibacillus composti TaxID=1572762 RepID=A0A8J4M1Y7_9BACL|nr:putative cysteine ligase BshC [Xylanibacillus composti]
MYEPHKTAERFEVRYDRDQDWQSRAAWLDSASHLKADKLALAEALEAYNRKVGNTDPRVASHIDSLREGAFVVVGGQQAGLFGGPLLVIYKAVTIIRAAKEAAAKLNRTVVPVFWIAGEDHDFDEVNHTYVTEGETGSQIKKISLSREAPYAQAMVSGTPITPAQWSHCLDELARLLPDTSFKPGLLDKAQELTAGAGSLSESFARLLAWLFGAHGLIVMDAADPSLRKLEQPMFAAMLTGNRAVRDAALTGKQAVERLGYEPQVAFDASMAHLFAVDRHGRRPLLASEDGFQVKGEAGKRSLPDMLARLEEKPEDFSNNVMTRPVMQEYLFPVVAAVLGPGEIAYWGMLKELFAVYGMKMPIIVPRTEVTVIDASTSKLMAKYGLDLDQALLQLEESRQSWLMAKKPAGLNDRFADTKKHISRLYDPLLDALSGIHEGMRQLGQSNLRKLLEQVEYLERRTDAELAGRHARALGQWSRIAAQLHPLGKRQERVLNVFVYLNSYGSDFVHMLVEQPLQPGAHYVMYI